MKIFAVPAELVSRKPMEPGLVMVAEPAELLSRMLMPPKFETMVLPIELELSKSSPMELLKVWSWLELLTMPAPVKAMEAIPSKLNV